MVKRILISLVLVLTWSSIAPAAGPTTWTWEYPEPLVVVAGFRMYCNGIVVTEFIGADTRVGVVSEELLVLSVGDSCTLTAFTEDGNESPHSAPYVWTGSAVAINRMLRIKTGNTPAMVNRPGRVKIQ